MLSHLVVSLVALAGTQIELQTVDGRTVGGALERLATDVVVVRTADGEASFQPAELLQLTPVTSSVQADDTDTALEVELMGGSRLMAASYEVDEDTARMAVGQSPPVKASLRAVRSVRSARATDAELEQWRKIVDEETIADVLVVRKRDVIDFLEGIVHQVSTEEIEFEVDGETIPVKWGKVFGFVYRARQDDLPAAVCRMVTTSGSELAARELRLIDRDIEVVLTTGDTVRIPLQQLERIDFSQGKVVYLSDLDWDARQSERQSFYGGVTAVESPLDLFAPQRDRALDGGELLLGGKPHARGLALHSRTRLVYRVPEGYRRFTALAGIDDRMDKLGDVQLLIEGDGRALLQIEARGGQPPTPIDVDISGVKRLAIVVDFGANQDVADHLDLCEAKLIR